MMIGVAEPDDLPAIEELRRAAFNEFAPAHYSPREVANLLDDFDAEQAANMIAQRAFFVARAAERLAGCAAWHGGAIRHVYVTPELTGRGLGRRILLHAEDDFCRRTGAGEIAAGVIVYAKGFYEKNGYRVLSKEKDWDGSAYYRMVKVFEPVA